LQTLTEPSTPAGSAESDAAETFSIGNIAATAYNRGFDGIIADARVYDRELTAVEINNIMLQGFPNPDGLVAMWQFTGGAPGTSPSGGGSVKDIAAGKSDGTPNSTPVYAATTLITGATRRRAS